MIKKIFLFLLVINLNYIAVANETTNKSEEEKAKQNNLPSTNRDKEQLSIGFEIFPYSYQEPNLMQLKGILGGINAAYILYLNDKSFLNTEIRLAYGRTNYSSNGSGKLDNLPNVLLEYRVLYNQSYETSPTVKVTPFMGIGFRYKSDDSSYRTTTTRHYGYLRKSNYIYLPVGLSINYKFDKNLGLSMTGEYDIFLAGTQKSYLKNYFQDSVNNKQSKGYGLRSELLINRNYDNYIISAGPFLNYWKIEDSNIVDNFFEPRNITKEIGLKLKVSW